MGAFKDKIVEELALAEQDELAEIINGMNSDVDVANYLASAGPVLARRYTTPDLEAMPEFRKALYAELKTGKVDYEKEFGKDWYKKWGQIPVDQIRFVADKQGLDWKELNKKMAEDATKALRYDIAHDGTVAGAITNMVFPRSVEAVERGESPSPKDVTLDVGENALYAVPWARGAQAIAKSGRVYNVLSNPLVQGGLSNVTQPLVSEAADAALYDEGPRGEFNPYEVGAGVGTNIVGGALLRGAGAGIGRVNAKAGAWLRDLGEGKTAAEMTDDLAKQYRTFNIANADNPAVSAEIRKFAQDMKSLSSINPELYAAAAGRNAPIWEIAAQPGKNIEEKTVNWLKTQGVKDYALVQGTGDIVTSPDLPTLYNTAKAAELEVTPELAEHYGPMAAYRKPTTEYVHSPVTYKLLTNYDKLGLGRTEGAKTLAQLASEESAKNYMTNQFGSYQNEQGKALTRIPIFGPYVQQVLDEKEAEALRKAEEEAIKEDLKRKYKVIFGE